MSHVSDLDHLRLDATVYPDCVVEVHRISDISRGLRKVAVTKIWRIERVLGRGAFGEVQLQVQDREPEARRAVKVIPTDGRMSGVDCLRELTALIEFTKPKVSAHLPHLFSVYSADDWYSTKPKQYLSSSSDGSKAMLLCTWPWSTYP
jgi:hypothetical protein